MLETMGRLCGSAYATLEWATGVVLAAGPHGRQIAIEA